MLFSGGMFRHSLVCFWIDQVLLNTMLVIFPRLFLQHFVVCGGLELWRCGLPRVLFAVGIVGPRVCLDAIDVSLLGQGVVDLEPCSGSRSCLRSTTMAMTSVGEAFALHYDIWDDWLIGRIIEPALVFEHCIEFFFGIAAADLA